MHSSYAFTLPFKAHWLRAPWSIFRLYVAKLKCGDECQREGFVPGCSNTACPFSERLSSRRERQSCLFCPGTMGRLVVKVEGWPIRVWLRHHEALISKGVEGYLLPPVLNRGVEGQSSSVVMVEGSDTCRHQKRWLPLSMSEVSHRNSFYWSQKILLRVVFIVWVILFLLCSPGLVFAHGFGCGNFSRLFENPSHIHPTSRDSLWNHDMNESSVKINCRIV